MLQIPALLREEFGMSGQNAPHHRSRSGMKYLVFSGLLRRSWCAAAKRPRRPFRPSRRRRFSLDADTRAVLFEKSADELVAPASMAKIMTAEVVFNELKSGRLTMDSEFTVSVNAWKKGGAGSGGSAMFAKVNSAHPARGPAPRPGRAVGQRCRDRHRGGDFRHGGELRPADDRSRPRDRSDEIHIPQRHRLQRT